jgi:tetratricopeptide (TPR) repeat protein
MRLFICSIAVIALAVATGSGAAQLSPRDNLELGRQYFDAGSFKEAYDHLFEAFKMDPGNPEINFLLGRAAFEMGDYEAAIMAYERVLISKPDLSRVKLEMARCFFHLKSYETAKQYFNEVLETNPPDIVRKNIENFLAAIDAAQTRHIFSGLVSTGVTFDDNVRVSPANDTISTIIGDVTFIGESATPQSDRIYTTTELLNHVYRFENNRMRWETTGLNYNAFYQFADDLDQNYFILTAGPEMRFGKYILEVQGILNQLYLSYDRYLGTCGLPTILSYAPKPDYLLNFGLLGQQKDFYQNQDRDTLNIGASGNAYLIFAPNRIGFGLSGEYKDSDNDLYSYHRYRINLRYDRLFPFGFNAFAGYRYQKTKYDEQEPLFARKRSDDLNEIIAGISKTLWRSDDSSQILTAFISFTVTDSNSNIELYTYDNNVVVTSLELRF